MWAENSVFYQIYPLGFCGAPKENDGVTVNRIGKIADWADHIQRLGADAVYLSPIFESDRHGYDTRDYRKIDCRLGTNEDFAKVCETLHAHGIRVVLDGVFNHVGRGFWAFKDVQEKKWDSSYKDWFHIHFDGNSNYNDGFWYEGWEGHFELVKLNLRNPAVVDYLLDCVRSWVEEYDIDGLRLDVAYCLDRGFLGYLRRIANELSERRGQKFLLLGETMFGDYRQWMGDDLCDTVTNYEVYKGLWSSFNSANMHEVAYSLDRQSGDAPWDLYTGLHLLDFADNHDVPRIATKLDDKRQLEPLYGLLFGMPGVPCVYYGSEWGIEGEQNYGDHEIRPALDAPEWNSLSDWIASLARARRGSTALMVGDYRQLQVGPTALVFQRSSADQRVIVAVNASDAPQTLHFDAGCGRARDLITGEGHDFGGGSEVPAFGCRYWLCER